MIYLKPEKEYSLHEMVVKRDIVQIGKAAERGLNINRKEPVTPLMHKGDGPLSLLAFLLLQQESRHADKRHCSHLG